jgi:hypothetical protein
VSFGVLRNQLTFPDRSGHSFSVNLGAGGWNWVKICPIMILAVLYSLNYLSWEVVFGGEAIKELFF